MYPKFTSHDAKKSSSSSQTFNYLEKENNAAKLKNEQLILEGREDEIEPNSVEYFFNQDFNPFDINDKNSLIDMYEATMKIDANRGTQKLDSSNFYMLNLSPSVPEQEHMENIAMDELKSRGLILEDVQHDELALSFFNEQKDQLMKLQLKLYTQEVMNLYAEHMDREIYANQEALPSDAERKNMKPEIEERYNQFLLDNNIELILNTEEQTFIDVEKYKIVQEYEHGKLFSIYNEELNKNLALFIPTNKFKIENEALKIDELYYSEKYLNLISNENEKRNLVEINGSHKYSSDNFIDFIKDDKILIKQNWEKYNDTEMKLYFDKKDLVLVNGEVQIPVKIYEDKVYEFKTNFLSKEFADVKNSILNERIAFYGYDVAKIANDENKEVFKNPHLIPSKEELKKINIEASVEFNKYLVKNKYLPEKESFKITDWNTKVPINSVIIAESEKAKLLEIIDERLDEPKQMWVANFAIMNSEGKLDVDSNGKINIINQFYENKIGEVLELQKGEKINFTDYVDLESFREKFDTKSDSVEFTFENLNNKFKHPFKFNINIENLELNKDGKFCTQKELLEHKFEKHLINHCKHEFRNDYKKIVDTVNKSMLEEKNNKKNSEIEKQFKNFLVEKKIIESNVKNDEYKISAKIEETKNNSSLISYKEGDNDVKFWVNNKLISSNDKVSIYFKDEKAITKILDSAIERDKIRKQLVEIKHSDVSLDAKKENGKDVEFYTFHYKATGLEEPVKFTVGEKDVIKKNGKYFTEKYKLDYKLDKAIKQGITKEFGNVKDEIKNEVWKENGFDVSKRKITGKDLLYYGKIETERKYSHKDKAVLKNKPILEEIENLKSKNNPLLEMKIGKLESQLLRDKNSNEIIKEGVKKGGMNYHSHVIISRHDNTSINPKDKVSMSPNANSKDGVTNNGAKIGFNRTEFAQSVEKMFDEKFEYERPEREKFANLKKSVSQDVNQKVKGLAKGILKKEIMKHTGMNIVKNELMPTQHIKQQLMPIPIPTSFPKSKLDLIIKAIKLAKNLIVDKGVQY